MAEKELANLIQKRLVSTQISFDLVKETLITVGLFVAAGITLPSLYKVKIVGHSGIKVVLASTTLSAIFLVLSFVFAEHQSKRHDRIIGPAPFKKIERIVLGQITLPKAKLLSWYYVKLHDLLITACNNVSTLLLLFPLA